MDQAIIAKPITMMRGKLCYFGASTGAAAAIVTAANNQEIVKAIVTRGGRPDLAGGYLNKVRAPTLLIIGGDDRVVIEMNTGAFEELETNYKKELVS